jgi:hypothetical protein
MGRCRDNLRQRDHQRFDLGQARLGAAVVPSP